MSDEDVLMQHARARTDHMAIITSSPALKKLFIQLNTSLPASAAAERLFSCASLTMNSRRTRMSETLFEELVVLKANNHL